MEQIKIRVYAKINLKLDINGTFDDGYHSLNMDMASIDVFDVIKAYKAQKSEVYMDGVLQDEKNTATKAVELLELAYGYPIKIEIEKHIPMKAGVGGSSADAAGVFYCYSKLYGVDTSYMTKLALSVGSDVVYMMKGGPATVKGRGEIVHASDYIPLTMVIAQKSYGGETSQVYKKFDEVGRVVNNIIDLGNGKECFNVLEKPAETICEDILNTKIELSKYTDKVFMTGSGSAVIGIFNSEDEAKACSDKLDGYIFNKVIKTLPYGIEEI